ncbi:MAG: hypothetical protein PQ612_05440 [Rickettsiales bacterium]|nr:hypothetical protein [Pseudomonadota bacterium]MDA0966463.1 hypothetical protein [Pseudomonadota bacterium]MDG4543325.1 hypothetical protein [Rickettsiales bacterium]MDG4545591.1 hypothetical protein [Rickettsiales bacterium]MDG4548040.1 hypothetical protein [Rickettsiales bacterium]
MSKEHESKRPSSGKEENPYMKTLGFETEDLIEHSLGQIHYMFKQFETSQTPEKSSERGHPRGIYGDKDTYDLLIVLTENPNDKKNGIENSNVRHQNEVVLDYDRYEDTEKCEKKACFEFITREPIDLDDEKDSKKRLEEYKFMMDHFYDWKSEEFNKHYNAYKDDKSHSDSSRASSRTRSGKHTPPEYYESSISKWVDKYNKEINTNHPDYQELIISKPKEKGYKDFAFEWLLVFNEQDFKQYEESVAKQDINKKSYVQINAAIPAEMIFSPEMRALVDEQKTEDYVLFKKGKVKEPDEFNTQRPRPTFIEFEKNIYEQSRQNADNFFDLLSQKTSEHKPSEKLRGFARSVSYISAMESISEEALTAIFMEDGEANQETAQNLADTIRKDKYPKGMPKFVLNDFFKNILSESDQKIILDNKTDFTKFVSSSTKIGINESSKKTGGKEHEPFKYVGKNIRPTPWTAEDIVTNITRNDNEKSPYTDFGIISGKPIDVERSSVVVEFRDLGAKDHSNRTNYRLIDKFTERYKEFHKAFQKKQYGVIEEKISSVTTKPEIKYDEQKPPAIAEAIDSSDRTEFFTAIQGSEDMTKNNIPKKIEVPMQALENDTRSVSASQLSGLSNISDSFSRSYTTHSGRRPETKNPAKAEREPQFAFVLGRGGKSNNSSGNQIVLKVVQDVYEQYYERATKDDKTIISNSIVIAIIGNGIPFMQMNEKNELVDINTENSNDVNKVRKKISQKLRDQRKYTPKYGPRTVEAHLENKVTDICKSVEELLLSQGIKPASNAASLSQEQPVASLPYAQSGGFVERLAQKPAPQKRQRDDMSETQDDTSFASKYARKDLKPSEGRHSPS